MLEGTILVTGAAGFIGAAVSEALTRRGDRVLGIDNLSDYYPVQLKRDRVARVRAAAHARFGLVEADFANDEALEAAVAGHA